MNAPRAAILVAALALAAPAPAAADAGIIGLTVGESWAYLSAPWEQNEPITSVGLRWLFVDSDFSMGMQGTYARPVDDLAWDSSGVAGLEFLVRFHDRLRREDVSWLAQAALGYRHYWAEADPPSPPPPGTPKAWDARNGFGLRLGGGMAYREDTFYLDLVAWVGADLLWPEPSYAAGAGLDLTVGIYLD